MKYSKDMLLESASGFVMPFPGHEGNDVQISLGYGEQIHPNTGEKFHHQGLDLVAYHVPLFAIGSGVVTAVGNDATHGNFIIVRYNKYDVKYGHMAAIHVRYGQPVEAGLQIGESGDFLHFEVHFEGQMVNPVDFLGMLYGNVMQLLSMGMDIPPKFTDVGVQVTTDYESDWEEIQQMMLHHLPHYMNELRTGTYEPPVTMIETLRNIFSSSSSQKYFFEQMPTIGNPLGLSGRGAPMARKVQNLLLRDFLVYMALRHNTYVSTWTKKKKKNFMTRHMETSGL